IGPEALDLLGHARLGPGADGDHGDHGAHPDDDAEHGESTAQLVHAERADGDANSLDQGGHAGTSSASSGRLASATAASRGAATSSSSRRRPSRKVSVRAAKAAISGS